MGTPRQKTGDSYTVLQIGREVKRKTFQGLGKSGQSLRQCCNSELRPEVSVSPLDRTAFEFDRPRGPQIVNGKRRKPWIIVISMLMFMLGANALYRDNALEESYGLLL